MNTPASHAPPPGCILAIDDEEANLRLLQALLGRAGYRVVTTHDPRQALELFDLIRPDLVLVDLHMPGMNGFEVVGQIRGSEFATGYLPIVMVTGDSSTAVRQRALAEGATDFVAKPFDNLEVMLRIRNLLEARRLHTEIQKQNSMLEEMVRARTVELETALARAEAAALAKTEFLAKMSHELRTPLNPIRGVLEVLLDGASEHTLRMLAMASRNVDRMVTLIDDILYLQGIEQGNIRPDVYPVYLGPLALDAVEAMEARAERGGLRIEAVVPESVAPIVTDPLLLSDVLRRLLDNAIRFTREGQVTVTVAAAADGSADRIEVRDTGAGIADDRLRAIFETFEQADNSSTRSYEGAGLGLSICRRLLELMGHRLEATSAEGSGSTFTILLRAGSGA
ncbi:MAG: response regulator [Gemmatimonadetes bacterium]|nr:response regulator [Gemmatimonadota bacterium]